MTLEDFRKIIRGITPGLKESKLDDPFLDLVINSMVVDVVAYTKCLPTEGTFTVTAETGTYNLSSVLTNFLVPDKPGLWWNDGEQWQKLNPRTMQWLDENRPNWRDLDSDDPQDYDIRGNVITIVPKPDTTLASGFKMYYGKKPTNMTSPSHYPFSGSTVEIPNLIIFDYSIIYGSRWKLKGVLSKYRDEYNQDQNLYLQERERAYAMYKRRPDISASRDTRFQGPSVRT